MSLFISTAAAATNQAAQPAGGAISSIIMLVAVFVVFYLFLWRPQSRRAKEHRDLLGNLSVGDEVVTTGGVLGKVTQLSENFAVLMIADNVEIKVQKSAISASLPKGTLKSI